MSGTKFGGLQHTLLERRGEKRKRHTRTRAILGEPAGLKSLAWWIESGVCMFVSPPCDEGLECSMRVALSVYSVCREGRVQDWLPVNMELKLVLLE